MTMSVPPILSSHDISEAKTSESSTTNLQSKTTTKRSFDVAFLISPDDRLTKQKRKQNSIVNYQENQIVLSNESLNETRESSRSPESEEIKSYQKYSKMSYEESSPTSIVHHQSRIVLNSNIPEILKYNNSRSYHHRSSPPKQIFDDPRVITTNADQQKSAFTKVKLDAGIVSPNHSLSPDLNYQNSLSPSPPLINVANYNVQKFQNLLPAKNLLAYSTTQNTFLEQTFPNDRSITTQASSPIGGESSTFFKNHPNVDNLFSTPKLRHHQNLLNYRPEMSPYTAAAAAYPVAAAAIGAFHTNQGTAPTDLIKLAPNSTIHPHQPADIIKLQTNPAAAILSSLLPTSFAALSLPAQNVCAKCNISFRMTSDLVYHMRSHHKSEMANDSFKKRREDKLKCPVCSESFRERHHLTRHMTAHQDKEGDGIEDNASASSSKLSPGVVSNVAPSSSRKVRNSMSNNGINFNNVYCK